MVVFKKITLPFIDNKSKHNGQGQCRFCHHYFTVLYEVISGWPNHERECYCPEHSLLLGRNAGTNPPVPLEEPCRTN